MSDKRKYEGLTPEDAVAALRVLVASEGPALKVRPIGNMGGGGDSGGGSSGTKNYPDLLNKPRINGVELVGNKTSKDLGLTSESGDIPDKLPNPHALTIQYDNVKTVYDGSSAKSVTIPKVEPVVEINPLTIIDGEDQIVYDGKSPKSVVLPEIPDMPTIPDKLPNPKSFTINVGGVDTVYDGSQSKQVVIPDRSANPGKLIVSQSEKQDIEYDGSTDVNVHLPSASVIAEKDVLFSDVNFNAVGETVTLANSYQDYEYLVFTFHGTTIDKIGHGVPTASWVKVSDIVYYNVANNSDCIVLNNGANQAIMLGFIDDVTLKFVADNSVSNTTICHIGCIGMNFVQPPMNPFPLVITQGDAVHEYTGHETVNVTIPDISKGIKNPNALTIKEEGKADVIYDGSVGKEINIPTIPDFPEIPEIPTKLPNPYALTVNFPDGSTKVYDGSDAKSIDIPAPSVDNKSLTLRFGDQEVVYDGKVAKEVDVQIPEKLPNPEKLTIRSNSGSIVEYDGTSAENVLVDKMDALVNVDVLADNFPAWKDGQVFDLASDISEFDYILIDYALCRSGNISAYNYSETKWVKTDDLLTSPDKDVLLSNIRQNDAIFIGASIVTFPDNNTFKTATLRSSTHGNYIIQVLRVSGVKFDRASDKIGGAPVGEIIAYMGNTPPENYLVCDGAEYNISDYHDLATHFQSEFGSANHFGGDGVTTFAVPDLRGEFLRGSGTNGHEYEGNGGVVGEHQPGTSVPRIAVVPNQPLLIGDGDNVNQFYYVDNKISSDGAKTYNLSVKSTAVSSSTSVRYRVRPTNTSVMYCIKAKVTYNLDNGEAASNTPNEELTIKIGDDEPKVYDGTSAVSVQIPDKNPSPNALTLYDDNGNGTVYDGSVAKSVHLSNVDVLAQRVILADNIPTLAAGDIVHLSQDITEFDTIVLNYGIDTQGSKNSMSEFIDITDNYLSGNGMSSEIVLMRMYGVADRYTAISVFQFVSKNELKLDRINRYISGQSTKNAIKLNSVVGVKYIDAKDKLGESPVGEIIPFMGTDAPKNYLVCDGSEHNIIDYPELAGHFATAFGESNHFGGDGVTTFAVPDLRGEFLRGTGEAGRATGSGADVGDHQEASEILTFFTGNEIGVRRNVRPDETKFDTYNMSSNQCIVGTARVEGNDYPCGIATTRPTNTSVLYCIKCRSTYSMNYKIDNYSSEEHVCGVWVDGKTLYEKTVVVNLNRQATGGLVSVPTECFPEDADDCFIYEGCTFISSGDNNLTLGRDYYSSPNEFCLLYISRRDVIVHYKLIDFYTMNKSVFRIRYTKK